jgi:hypothetical protein
MKTIRDQNSIENVSLKGYSNEIFRYLAYIAKLRSFYINGTKIYSSLFQITLIAFRGQIGQYRMSEQFLRSEDFN